MSRRPRHGRHAPQNAGARPQRAAAPSAPALDRSAAHGAAPPPQAIELGAAAPVPAPREATRVQTVEAVAPAPQPVAAAPVPASPPSAMSVAPVSSVAPAALDTAAPAEGDALRTTCTQAQLRRFIKSRPWIPMHELRRRFGIYGGDDDVTPVRIGATTVFVGLPPAEGRMLGELLVSGDVGYELSLDPGAPIVVGVYPMRPVPRG